MTNDDIIDDTGAYSSAMAEDGDSAIPTKRGKDEDEAARQELDAIHEHADPSKGNKLVEGGDRVRTDGAYRGAADEQATKAERSIKHGLSDVPVRSLAARPSQAPDVAGKISHAATAQ